MQYFALFLKIMFRFYWPWPLTVRGEDDAIIHDYVKTLSELRRQVEE